MILENEFILLSSETQFDLSCFYIHKLILSQYLCKKFLVAIKPFYFDEVFFLCFFFQLLHIVNLPVELRNFKIFLLFCFVQKKGKWKTYE